MADAPDVLGDLDSPDVSRVMEAAIGQVRILTRAADRYRRYVRLLFIVCLVIALLVIALGWLFTQQRQDAITACKSGNNYRAAQVHIWDKFIAIIIAGNHDPQALAEAHAFTGYVARTDALNNCSDIYRIP